MEIPAVVLVHNETLGLKGSQGTLLRVLPEGYYELNVAFGQNEHRVLLPVAGTVLIQAEPETRTETSFEIER